MIYLYNETKENNWEIFEKNENFDRIGVKDTRFGIDVYNKDKNEECYFKNTLENEQGKLLMLSCMSFYLCYNNNNGLPFVKNVQAPTDFSQDLFLLSYKIPEGFEIVNEMSSKFTIQYSKFDKENSMLHIIGLGRPADNPNYYLTFSDKERTKYITKHLVTLKKNNSVNVFIQEYTKEEAEASQYKNIIIGKGEVVKIRPTKVRQPYSVISYPFSNTAVAEAIEKKFHKNPQYVTLIDTDKPAEEYFAELSSVIETHRAATFFVNKPFAEADKNDVKIQYSKMFERFNLLTNDFKIKSF